MSPEDILKEPPIVLSQAQRESYFETGYLLLPEFLDEAWLNKIREVAAEFVEESKSCLKSNEKFDVEPTHTAENPKLRRLSFPVDSS